MGNQPCPFRSHRPWQAGQPFVKLQQTELFNQIQQLKEFNLSTLQYKKNKQQIFMNLRHLSAILIISITSSFFIQQNTNEVATAEEKTSNLAEELKYNGKGFGTDLQNVLLEALTDAAIYYREKLYSQTTFINKALKKAKPGIWHVLIFENLNISKITEVSTGFSYWTDNDTWALWYNSSSYTQGLLHMVIYNGEGEKDFDNATSKDNDKGPGITGELPDVISSIAKSMTTVQDIAKYIQKFDPDSRKWSVISIPSFWNNKYPDAMSTLSTGGCYVTYSNYTKIAGKDSSLIIFV